MNFKTAIFNLGQVILQFGTGHFTIWDVAFCKNATSQTNVPNSLFHQIFHWIYWLSVFSPFGHLFNVAERLSHEEFIEHWEDSDFDSLNDLFGLDEMPDTYLQLESN